MSNLPQGFTSKPTKLNLIGQPNYQEIHKRLIEVAIYDYLDMHVPVRLENKLALVVLLQVLSIPKDDAVTIVDIFLSRNKKPTTFEYLLLYNQLEAKSNWTRMRFKINGSINPSKTPQPHQILPADLPYTYLKAIVNKLHRVKHLKTQYENLPIFLHNLK